MGLLMYGTRTCVDCLRSRQFLDKHAVAYDYVSIEDTPGAAEKVQQLNNGMSITPTLVFEDGSILSEPTNQQLADKLSITE